MAKFQIPIERITTRANFFLKRHIDYCEQPDLSIYNIGEINFEYAQAVAECYFLINEFYKLEHSIPLEHNTEYSKIAAITAVAICNRKLLLRKNPNTSDLIYAELNPIFAIRLGLDRIGVAINKLSYEETDRLIQFIIDPELQCLENYFWKLKRNRHTLGSEIEFNISQYEMALIEGVISIFHFLEIAYHGPHISSR